MYSPNSTNAILVLILEADLTALLGWVTIFVVSFVPLQHLKSENECIAHLTKGETGIIFK